MVNKAHYPQLEPYHLSYQFLKETVERESSDLHLTINMPPLVRERDELIPLREEKLALEDINNLTQEILTPPQIEILEKERSVDVALGLEELGRFRINAYYQRGSITMVLRRLSNSIPSIERLHLPPVINSFSNLKDGLVLVTGATGSGKSTTLASVIDSINQNYRKNIITIEDPIEYIHQNQQSVVNQRELFSDVHSFGDALKASLRADPDVILIGEMRDLETIRTAITAAETGHLVFSTLHSRDTISTITRIISVFGENEQAQIRQQLSLALKAVITQNLVPHISGQGVCPAVEVLMVNTAISNLIRTSKIEQIYSLIEMGSEEEMQTMDQSLLDLVQKNLITEETALVRARNPQRLSERLKTNLFI